MKLSSETLNVLKNFASINANIVIDQGSTIKTMAEAKNVLGSAEVAETFPGKFGIYDLNEFLGVVALFDEPELDFDEAMNFVSLKEGRNSQKYYFSDPSILTTPQKDIKMPPIDLSFTLTEHDLNAIRKASGVLNVTDLVIKKEGEELVAIVTDSKNSTSNEYRVGLDVDVCELEDFEFNYAIPNFKFISGDYKVEISSKLISRFTGESAEYFVALEKTSKVGA